MKKISLLLILLSISSFSKAETLEQALVNTYKNNPDIQSARKSTMASDENVSQSLSGWRPTIIAGGNITSNDAKTNPVSASDGNDLSKNWNVSITQPIYKGGATTSSIESAKNTAKAYHESLKLVENNVLLSAVQSYVDVIRDNAILDLNLKNVELLEKNLEVTKARFDVGELTMTDVSQSDASLSNAKARVETSKGNLNSSIASYNSIIGNYPEELKSPEFNIKIPNSKDLAISTAINNNPSISQAKFLGKAAVADIDKAFAGILPEVNLVGKINKDYDTSDSVNNVRKDSIMASVTVPLYKSGSARSKIRQAKHISNQRKIEVISATKDIETRTVNAWEAYNTAKANIIARKAQIKANEMALEGVKEEEKVGLRTILDVLEAEQNLLDSKVELIKEDRNKIYNSYNLLASMGKLTVKDLNLPVDNYWNVKDNYNKVKNKWWGLGVE